MPVVQDVYCSERYSVVTTKQGQLRCRQQRLIYPSGDLPDFPAVAAT